MAGVCKRFKEIASSLFIKNFTYFHIGMAEMHSPKLFHNNKISLNTFNGIFCEFGPLIEYLSITPPQRKGKNCSKLAIKTISTHCTQNLRHIDLSNFKIDEDSSNYLNPVLNHLDFFHLKKCKLDSTVILNLCPNNNLTALTLYDMEIPNPEFFNRCNQLRKLSLSKVKVKLNAKIWNQHFPNLLEIDFANVPVNSQRVINFFRKNPQLQRVDIRDCINIDGSVLASIAKYLPNITSLDLFLNKFNQLFD